MNNSKPHILESRYQDPMLRSKGRLIFGIFQADQAKPVDNATIRVYTDEPEQTPVLVENLVSDISGQTLALELDSPPMEYSLNPESEQKPYSEYRVEVEAEGFELTTIEGIEILPNATAIQDVTLQPAQNQRERELIVIPEHTLWALYPPKIPEDSVKDLPPDTGFVVLDKPVIPEFVVVHDGLPTDPNAQNYYVKFKDYIKNVASCEIYATWPDATIRANILAIISFTLNRVFTEWYRNKGMNFTITSSTAHDLKW